MTRFLACAAVVGVGAFSLFACDPPAKEEDPPTAVGDVCNGDDSLCDSGQACVIVDDAEEGTCQALPDGCTECGDCDTAALCDEDAAGSGCFSIFSRVVVSCASAAEGEGEGEGE